MRDPKDLSPAERRLMDPATAHLMGALPKEERLELYHRMAILDEHLDIAARGDVLVRWSRPALDMFLDMARRSGLVVTESRDGLGFTTLNFHALSPVAAETPDAP